MLRKIIGSNCMCLAAVGIFGVLSMFMPSEEPDTAVKKFISAFSAQDAPGLLAMMYPEIVAEKEIKVGDLEQFLTGYHSKSLTLKSFRVDEKLKSEDGSVERFKTTLIFRGPVLAPEYPNPPEFRVELLWIMEDGKWWLERTLSMNHVVEWNKSYPTPAQNEAALRFKTTLEIMDKIGMVGNEDQELMTAPAAGEALQYYQELEKLYSKERGPNGVDPKTEGVQVFLKAASFQRGGFLKYYQGDFPAGPDDKRRPMPWETLNDYVQAAIERAKASEKQGNKKAAESIYKRLIAFGHQILEEPGGVQFILWGTTFQKQAAEELTRVADRSQDREKALALVRSATRRLDLLQTALSCLDDMEDYKALSAATIAASRNGDTVFRPWGISTLAILALKGAPANQTAIKAAGGIVVLNSPAMQKKAEEVLTQLSADPSGKLKSYIEFQKEWVKTHKVFGGLQALK
ncbi:MAG: hypothetical protein HY912_17990 [Desulfomonile tiedjei]|uniref:Uncharacterized protein n=1 Tax=Desulfomonile tiedjei TaxID=2358 RepID=A0A9D6Z4U4_9BACT|nr:hypothetical protein [Desulfomonile tiedjei]